ALGGTNDLVPPPMHKAGSVRAHIAEALNDYARLVPVHAEPFESLVADNHQPPSRGLIAPLGTAQFQWFSCNDGSDRVAHMHGVGIHDPGHDLLVRVDVRTRDIFFRTQDLNELRSVPSGESLEFTLRHLVWIAYHPTSCAAERDVHQGTFPCHPTREGTRLVKGQVGAVTDATLGWPPIDRVLHPESGEYLQTSIVQLHGDMHDDSAAGFAQYLPQTLVQRELLRGQVRPCNLCFPSIDFLCI